MVSLCFRPHPNSRRRKERGEDDGEREPTQEELLEEAKLTERLNLVSLKRFEEMELEAKKKATRLLRREVKGPFVRYLSTTMPLIEEVDEKVEEKIFVDDDDEEDDNDDSDKEETTKPNHKEEEKAADGEEKDEGPKATTKKKTPKNNKAKRKATSGPKQERTFLTFSDHETLRKTLPQKKPRLPQQRICPITRLPAKYYDPVTRCDCPQISFMCV